MSHVDYFKRSDTQFFHAQRTHRAISALAKAERLVVYCGAGVTIDKTGLAWADLADKVYAPVSDDDHHYPTRSEIRELTRAAVSPTQVASVLHQYGLDARPEGEDLTEFITARLHQFLYREAPWRSGRLANAVAALAYTGAFLQRRVAVVTSNYDIHIELNIEQLISNERELASTSEGEAGVRVKYRVMPPRSNSHYKAEHSPQPEVEATTATIDMHYLHGRVAPGKAAEGRIVISEVDYAETRDTTLDTLRSLVNNADAVLIVGASLTDPPLIEALATSRDRKNRYCLIPIESTGISHLPTKTVGRLCNHLSKRAASLGVNLLLSDFKYQVAQFCEEIELRYTAGADTSAERYGQRLTRWWDTWIEVSRVRKESEEYLALVDALAKIRNVTEGEIANARSEDDGEVLRVELWVRDNPRTERRLTMWANSAGTIVDHDVMSSADLDIHSSHASVRAFIEGRPQHLDREELEDLARRTLNTTSDSRPFRYRPRWISYLAVPITVPVGEGHVTVGVVTLSSNRTRKASCLDVKVASMVEIVSVLRAAGRDLLTLEELVPNTA